MCRSRCKSVPKLSRSAASYPIPPRLSEYRLRRPVRRSLTLPTLPALPSVDRRDNRQSPDTNYNPSIDHCSANPLRKRTEFRFDIASHGPDRECSKTSDPIAKRVGKA